MLQLSASVTQRSVLSLRTGTVIAQVVGPIIDPDKLTIEGFYCSTPDFKQPLVLLCQDIRETLAGGLVVNDTDALTEPEELIRHHSLLERSLQLIHLPVETISGDKVGRINDYAYETTTMIIKKLYVTQSFLKHLTTGSLSIDRNQIHEVIIQDLLETVSAAAVAPTS
jgi:uncharacterized protein YrrD